MSDPVFVGTADAARVYGIAPRTLRKRLDAGTIQGQKINGAWMVPVTREQLLDAGIDPDSAVETRAEPAAPPAEPMVGPPIPAEMRPDATPTTPARAGTLDMTPLAELLREATERAERNAVAAAMWQERAQHLEAELTELKALPAGEDSTIARWQLWWRKLRGE